MESLVGLSVAMAKKENSNNIPRGHVIEEAVINLDSDEDVADSPLQTMTEEPNEELFDDPAPIGSRKTENCPSQFTASTPKTKSIIPFDEYKRLTDSIVIFIRREEEKRSAEATNDDPFEGVRRSEIVYNYLEAIADDIDNEKELVEKRAFIDEIIYRLMHHDQILIPSTSGLDRDEVEHEDIEDQFIVVHPTYCPET